MNLKRTLVVAQVFNLLTQLLRLDKSYGYACAFHVSRLTTAAFSRCTLSRRTASDALCEDIPTIGLYVHIPYCRQRCRYCDFAIVPIGKNTDTESNGQLGGTVATVGFRALDANYADAVVQEIKLQARLTQTVTMSNKVALRSIYFGGGTPSLAPIETLRRIMTAIFDETDSPFTVDRESCEITIEADPGTFSLAKLQAFRNLGFNRLSLGAQSFDDNVLESIGRVHRSRDVLDAIEMIRTVYGDEANYSIDLISGLPGVSLAAWVETLETALSLRPCPTHLSIYDLQIEKGTVFGKWYDEQPDDDEHVSAPSNLQRIMGDPPISTDIRKLPSARESAFMYKYAAGYLRAKGYEHYEVSSYARRVDATSRLTSYRSQHNQIYWALDGQWFAVGLGATSFVNGRTTVRPRTLVDYKQWVQERVSSLTMDDDNEATSLDMDFLMETALKRLRTSEGLSMNWIRDRFGDHCVDAVLRGAELGINLSLATFDRETSMLCLSDPDGFLFSNSIISSIFVELERVGSRPRDETSLASRKDAVDTEGGA